MSVSCGKQSEKDTQQLVAGPPGPVAPSPNPQPSPDKKDFPYLSRVYATSADLPVCTESLKGALAYLMVQKIFQSCDANTWVTVDIGNKQATGGKALEIFDAENNKVGNLIGPYDLSGQLFLGLVFLDGVTLNLPRKALDAKFYSQGKIPDMDYCYYRTSDCSGMCYAKVSNSTELVIDKSNITWQSTGVLGVYSTAGDIRYKAYYNPNSNGFICDFHMEQTSPTFYETKPYAPTQFKYPFALPLSVR